MKIALTLCLLAGLTGLRSEAQIVGYDKLTGGSDSKDVSIIQLIANPKAYNHQKVMFIGFLHLEFEGDTIYLHEDDFRHANTKNGIWVNIPDDMTDAQKAAVNNQYVLCEGVFRSDFDGHMDMNAGEMFHIIRLVVHGERTMPTASPTQHAPAETH